MSENFPSIQAVTPTIFLQGKEESLQQLFRIELDNPGAPVSACLKADTGESVYEFPVADLPHGPSTHEIYLDVVDSACQAVFVLLVSESPTDEWVILRQVPRRWVIHVVQNSHHDLGYTDLPSNVLKIHDRWLDQALDLAEETQDFPDESRFRIVIEQFWSLEHYLEYAPEKQSARMIRHIQSGQFEVNALYGNLTTELCSHEEILRALYPAFQLKRWFGIPLVSAEHNDIPGISWGLCQALTAAGIKLFIPGLPLYYNWGRNDLESFWDQDEILPKGTSGAFWWQAPSGSKLLVWDNGTGCGGDIRPTMPGLTEALTRLENQDYPYEILRWPVIGAFTDNSPYHAGYASAIRQWNSRWTYPRLVCSTNARFYKEFTQQDLSGLPNFRGELPGQDYPVGATSTAAATALNRNSHQSINSAEKLASFASLLTGQSYPTERLTGAYQDILLHDEHTWGFHFPAGPAAQASKVEKELRAYRAAALSHDVIQQSLGVIADHVAGNVDKSDASPGVLLFVFNPLGISRTDAVRVSLRELENCTRQVSGPQMDGSPTGMDAMRVTTLVGRDHLLLQESFLEGAFDLLDLSNNRSVPYQLEEVEHPHDPLPGAAERFGVGSGTPRLGAGEIPEGVKRDLVFIAGDVPGCGYKSYLLKPRQVQPHFPHLPGNSAVVLENEFYRLEVDRKTGGIASLVDKETSHELVDPACPYPFNSLIVRDPSGAEWVSEPIQVWRGKRGAVSSTIEVTATIHGHPLIRQSLRLYAGLKQVELSTSILKDAIPLLDVHLAFPFRVLTPSFRYEGVLSCLTPITDFLPGAHSDALTVQNWVKVTGGDSHVLWTPQDAPVARLGGLWEGYVSQAHRCFVPDSMVDHKRLSLDDLDKGWIFSSIYNNNFGTNFAVTQPGMGLFRYRLTSGNGDLADETAVRYGQMAVTPFESIFTQPVQEYRTSAQGSFLQVEGKGVVLLTLKSAEDGRGFVLRAWNPSPESSGCRVSFPGFSIQEVFRTNAVEEDLELLDFTPQAVSLSVPARDLFSARVILQERKP